MLNNCLLTGNLGADPYRRRNVLHLRGFRQELKEGPQFQVQAYPVRHEQRASG